MTEANGSHRALPVNSALARGNRASIRRRHAGRPRPARNRAVVKQRKWRWPKREIIFISDIHADGDALRSSLVAAGVFNSRARRTTTCSSPRASRPFIFGGDFFDKGPSNLRVLHVLKRLIDLGAKVRLLAGNHDLRVLYGMGTAGRTDDPRNGHFFARMGAKGLPFLQEIRDNYLQADDAYEGIPDEDASRTVTAAADLVGSIRRICFLGDEPSRRRA